MNSTFDRSFTVTVEYEYDLGRPASRDEPADPPWIEITSVCVMGTGTPVEILPILTKEKIADIEEGIWEELEDAQLDAESEIDEDAFWDPCNYPISPL